MTTYTAVLRAVRQEAKGSKDSKSRQKRSRFASSLPMRREWLLLKSRKSLLRLSWASSLISPIGRSNPPAIVPARRSLWRTGDKSTTNRRERIVWQSDGWRCWMRPHWFRFLTSSPGVGQIPGRASHHPDQEWRRLLCVLQEEPTCSVSVVWRAVSWVRKINTSPIWTRNYF